MTDKRKCSTRSLHPGSLLLCAFVAGISFPTEGFAYSGLTGKVTSLLCQTRIAAAGSQDDYARTLYAAADPVVQQRCLGCHVENGIAPNAGAKLALKSADMAEYESFNHQTFQTLVSLRSPQHVLSKAMGSAHGGGSVLTAFSPDYQALGDYLRSLDTNLACSSASGIKGSTNAEAAVWRGVGLSSPAETYRRAAIVLGRTVPSQRDLEDVSSGALTLDDAIEELMSGPGFHSFLVTGVNDQLLTDAFLNGLFPVNLWPSEFPLVGAVNYELYDNIGEEAFKNNSKWELWTAQNWGHAKAPPELIAYVVEQDLSYKEVLTADFTMVTPLTADIFDSEVEWGQEVVYNGSFSNFHMEFKPGVNRGQLVSPRPSSDGEGEICIPIPHGDCFMESFIGRRKAHAGVLSTIAFLQRYPTTETNRNRARARWAYKFFLGVDIEASAARTTDPVALADTNNPTMNNPACTVCHETMDPVAGAFQNYDERGNYRYYFDHSLPNSYTTAEGSLYQEGDTWFRDMRAPGFRGLTAPDQDVSLPWLAQQMANDPRFNVGTVEFWWPAVMGHEVLRAPEDPDLPGYDDQLMAFNLQRSEIARLASAFSRSGYRLKSLLKDLVRSRWFNAVSMSESHPYHDVLAIAGIGARRLLTPEELEAKTKALVGFTIDFTVSDWILPLEDSYLNHNRIALGGIDSYQVQSRARNLSAVAAAVVSEHGASVACALGQVDRLIADGRRFLLNGVDFSEPVSDTAALRERVTEIYERLHGKSYSSESPEVDLVVDLLSQAYELEYGCYSRDRDRLIEAARDQGILAEDPDRGPNDVEISNTVAWQLALEFMLSHFDFIYE